MIERVRIDRTALLGSLASLAAAFSGQVRAQDISPARPAAGSGGLEEVVVTAQRREERLQDVPVSVSVVSGAQIQARGTGSLEDLAATVPALVVTKGGVANRLSIRGIGSGDNNPLFEQSVATFVDGAYRGRSRASGATFLDLARVEVLKGPQSVYFGNNSIAGVLNIVSRDPGNTVEGDARYLYNFDFDRQTLEAALGGPVSDTLALRVAGIGSRGEGYLVDDGLGGIRVPRVREYAGRATAVWQPLERLTVKLKAQAEKSDQTGGMPIEIAHCPPSPAFPGPRGACVAALAQGEDVIVNQLRSNSPGQGVDFDSQSLIGTLVYEGSAATLTSITSGYWYDYEQRLDTDGTSLTLSHFTVPEDFSQFSQDFRIETPRDRRLSLAAGAYYQRDRLDGGVFYNFASLSPRLTGPFAALLDYGSFGQVDRYEQSTDTYALYAAATWRPLDDFSLTFGGRQSWVEKDIGLEQSFGYASSSFGAVSALPSAGLQALADTFGTAAGLGVVGNRRGNRSDAHFSPSVTAEYEVTPDVRLYAKYVDGFKAGGFNGIEHTGDPANFSFEPEYVDGYEIGLKTQPFDRLTVNVAVFRNDFSGLQVSVSQNTSTGVLNVIANAGGARAQGVEVESRLRISDGLTAGLNLTLLDSFYTDYANAGGSALDIVQGRPIIDLTDQPTRYAPDYSGNFDVNYGMPIGADLQLTLTGNLFFSDSYNFSNNNDPVLEQGSFTRVDAAIALGNRMQGWEVSLIGRNLTDEMVRNFGTNLGQSRGSYLIGTEEPRNVSVQARYKF